MTLRDCGHLILGIALPWVHPGLEEDAHGIVQVFPVISWTPTSYSARIVYNNQSIYIYIDLGKSRVSCLCIVLTFIASILLALKCDIVAYSSLTKHPYLCLSHHFLYILYIA